MNTLNTPNDHFEQWKPKPFGAILTAAASLLIFLVILIAVPVLLNVLFPKFVKIYPWAELITPYIIGVGLLVLIGAILRWDIREAAWLYFPRKFPWLRAILAFISWTLFLNLLENVISLFIPVKMEFYTALDAFTQPPLSSIILSSVAVVIIAPCAEEFVFRGITMSVIKKANPLWVAITISAVIFTLSHFVQITGLLSIMILAVMLALMAAETKSIFPGILLHVIMNSFAIIQLLYRTFVLNEPAGEWDTVLTPADIDWLLFAGAGFASLIFGYFFWDALYKRNKTNSEVY